MIASVIHLVDHEASFRKSLATIAESLGYGLHDYSDGDVFFDRYKPGGAGCVVVDVKMPRMTGLAFQKRLLECDVDLPLVLIGERVGVVVAVDAMKAGAFSVLEEPYTSRDLTVVLQEAVAHSRELRKKASLISDLRRRMESLTKGEQGVLKLLVAGIPNKSIARRLDMGLRTVELRRASLFKKLGASSLAEVVKLATIYEFIQNDNSFLNAVSE